MKSLLIIFQEKKVNIICGHNIYEKINEFSKIYLHSFFSDIDYWEFDDN